MCAIPGAHLLDSWSKIFVQTVFTVANCAVVGLSVLLLGFIVQSDIFAIMTARW